MSVTTPSLNVGAINELADFVESAKFDFDMGDLAQPSCGTAGCIGGHAAVLWEDVRVDHAKGVIGFDDEKFARRLGITDSIESRLCYLHGTRWRYSDITRPMAVAALRRLAATGEVHFDLADDKPESTP